MGTVQTIAPASANEPVTLQEARVHLRDPERSEDTYIGELLKVAREKVSIEMRRQLGSATYRTDAGRFPLDGLFEIDWPPLQSITSIQYYDTDEALQTLATTEYDVDTTEEPGRVTRAFSKTWPATYDRPDAVQVTFVAGYATAALVPAIAKHAIKLVLSHYYENREPVLVGVTASELPDGLRRLIRNLMVPI